MKIKIILIAWIFLLAGNSFAQQDAMKGRIIFRIKPEAIQAFRSAFESPEINTIKFDPQKFSLKDSKIISSLLGLPSNFKVTSIKPFIPQHNVVLEALRERTNPLLFPKVNSNGISIKESDDLIKLRTSEDHISRLFEIFFDQNINSDEVIKYLLKSGSVEFAEPRFRYSLCFTPNDPLYSQQYSLPLIHAPEAWDIVKCDSTMLVADDDVGTDWTHPDLANVIFINSGETGIDSEGYDKRRNGIDDDGDGFVDDWHGWDFGGDDGNSPDNDPNTPASHGTHTAGIMAASGNNKTGICGVAFGAKILVLKCGDNSGGDVAFGYEGIVYAADHGAKVVNNSWGGTNRSQVGQDIVNYATEKNCAVVAAGGNSSIFQDLYPASYDHVLSVAAEDQSGSIVGFSNYNTKVDVSAPGLHILSTVPNNGYEFMDGTSMASPNAAGCIALIRQKFPNLSADQATERLRATTDPLDAQQDIHPGYTGKGRINAKRAVSDDPVYSARLESVEILDQNNTGSFVSGETGDIILHVQNFLAPLTNLVANVEYLNDTAHAISANTQTVQFGKVNTLSLIQNFQGSYHVTISPNTPDNYTVLVKLSFISSPENYGPDVDYFYLTINKGYLDLDKNNLTVTFDSKGGIGYNDPPDNNQGSGFLWENAPSLVSVQGRDVLSAAGLMIGIPGDVRLVSSAPGEAADYYTMQDYRLRLPITNVTPSDHSGAIQELHTIFTDDNTDPTLQDGVTVDQKNYDFAGDLASNAVVLDYVIHKRLVEPDSLCYLTDSTAAALFMDWDIGPSGSINQAYISGFDTALSVARRMEPGYPYIGVKIISDYPAGSALNIYELNNNGSDGSASTYDGFDRNEKWTTMTTPRPFAGTDDVSMIYGLKNLPLSSQDSVRITFVIAMAENEALLKQTIDQTTKEWFGLNAVENSSSPENSFFASPNPFGNHLHLSWKSENPSSFVTLTDDIGRTVYSQIANGQTLDMNHLALPSGAYTVTIQTGKTIIRQQLICIP